MRNSKEADAELGLGRSSFDPIGWELCAPTLRLGDRSHPPPVHHCLSPEEPIHSSHRPSCLPGANRHQGLTFLARGLVATRPN
jgi:hypothetical protein